MFAGVIVENRPLAKEAIEAHQPFLTGWRMIHVKDYNVTDGPSYNQLMTSIKFWEALQNYEKVIIFQHDSRILRQGIAEFLCWDYIGAPWLDSAPWARNDRKGGNGGFSLRCPKKSLELIKMMRYLPAMGNEDVYFVHNLEKVGAKIAPHSACKKFSVESEFTLGTFGYHQIDAHLSPAECEQIRQQYNFSYL